MHTASAGGNIYKTEMFMAAGVTQSTLILLAKT